ncbi:hypothetical protein ACU686_40395 [Yinghuangia aomiensis]
MTDAYAYTDNAGNDLTVMGLPATTNNAPDVQISTGNAAAVMSVWVPPTDVHDVIAGVLAQAAAAQGRTWASALADVRDRTTRYADLTNTLPGQAGTVVQVHMERVTLAHEIAAAAPMLLALAEAYAGQDAPLWHEYKRVQGERDASDRKAKREYEHAVRLFAANLKLTAETKELRARVAELEAAQTQASHA